MENNTDFEQIKNLSESHDEEDRKKAIILLTKSCSVKALPILTEISENDPELNIKYYAKKAIFYLRKKLGVQDESVSIDSLPEKDGAGIKTRIQYSLYNVEPEIRKKALMVAIKFKDPYIIPSIITQLDKEEDPTVKAMMLKTLGLLGDIANMEDVVRFLNDEDSRVRANAVEAIEYLGNKRLFPALVDRLQDSDNRVRANAIRAMQHFGGPLTLKFLKSMASSANLPMRVSSAYALRFFPSPKVLPIIKALLCDRNSEVINKTCESLKVLASQNFEPAKIILAKFSQDGTDRTESEDIEKIIFEEENSHLQALTRDYLNSDLSDRRMTAVTKIQKNLPSGGFEVLCERLKIEEDDKIIASIILGIGKYRNEDCIEHLLPYLESAKDRIRANAIEALSLLDSPEVYPLLAMHLEDSNNRARANAIVGLKTYKYFNCRTYLMKMLESNEELMILSALYSILEFAEPELLDLLKHPYIYLNSNTQKKAVECLKMLSESNISGAENLYNEVKSTLDRNNIPGQEIYDEMIEAKYETTKTLTEEELEQEIIKNKTDLVEKTLLLLDEIYLLRKSYDSLTDIEKKIAFVKDLASDNSESVYNMLRFLGETEKSESVLEYVFNALSDFKDTEYRYVLKYDAFGQSDTKETSARKESTLETVLYQKANCSYNESIVELNKDLSKRQSKYRIKGTWEGMFTGQMSDILNSLRLDSQQMIKEILLPDEKIDYCCFLYKTEQNLRYFEGKISIDSTTSETSINLNWLKTEVNMSSFLGQLLYLDKLPRYFLLIITDKRLILFLRGSTINKNAYYHAIPLDMIQDPKIITRRNYNILDFSTGSNFYQVGGLSDIDSNVVMRTIVTGQDDKAMEKEHDIEKEMEYLQISFENGEISQQEYYKKHAELNKKLLSYFKAEDD